MEPVMAMLADIRRWMLAVGNVLTVSMLFAAGGAVAKSPRVDVCVETLQGQHLGAQWIVNAQKADGLFTYEYLPHLGRETDKNNIVRQVGTFWALVRADARYSNAASRAAIDAFRAGIARYIVESKAGGEEIAFIRHDGLGKLNAAAIYTIALVDMVESGIALNATEARILPKLVRGMRQMASENGGFWYIYYLPKEHNLITPYGSGEALYALAKYYGHADDAAEMRWVYDTFRRYYGNYFKPIPDFTESHVKGFFSWGIYAVQEIGRAMPVDYQAYVQPMLKEALRFRAKNATCADRGCMTSLNATDAVFLEGMVTGYAMAREEEGDTDFTREIRRYIDLARAHIVSRQVTGGGGFPGDEKAVTGGFCEDAKCNYMRNDINQHAMMALDRYLTVFCATPIRR
jgi:hypothetical protein